MPVNVKRRKLPWRNALPERPTHAGQWKWLPRGVGIYYIDNFLIVYSMNIIYNIV